MFVVPFKLQEYHKPRSVSVSVLFSINIKVEEPLVAVRNVLKHTYSKIVDKFLKNIVLSWLTE